MKLSILLQKCGIDFNPDSSLDNDILSISINSKEVKAGCLFIAIQGFQSDGHQYIDNAIKMGAAAIIGTREDISIRIPYFKVPNTRIILAKISDIFYHQPTKDNKFQVAGITGTNGKSTTAIFTRYLLENAGVSTGLIGTLYYQVGQKRIPAIRTTPESNELQRMFREMRNAGNKVGVMEVSSHSIELSRVDETNFSVAAFTNLTPEHLDFHADLEAYFQAKLRLFTDYLLPDGISIINMDDEHGRRIFELNQNHSRISTLGATEENDWHYEISNSDLTGSTFTLATPFDRHEVSIPVVGNFNVSNAVLAAAIATSLNEEKYPEFIKSLSSLPQVPGRLERIESNIFVDYAHTPDALEKTLKSLRFPGAKLTVVFGAGGDRDQIKRSLMGEAASQNADKIIITNDNPRNENPDVIAAQICKGIESNKQFSIILDRRNAIKVALREIEQNEVVLIAGKGHEEYQEINGQKIPFSDSKTIREVIDS